ncbi:MAG: S4 domain-containing protein, partial [Paracoccaceae bacterium]|nr:S4 domain-containing protein [Paracoccaceae bacterium]
MSGVQMIVVGHEEGQQRLDRFLRKRFPQLQQGRIEKMCRKGEVRVEGGRVKSSTRVESGQSVRVPPLPAEKGEARSVPSSVSDANARMIREAVIYKDDHLIAINKPPGLATQGGSKQVLHLDGLTEALKFERDDAPRLVHRLDKD